MTLYMRDRENVQKGYNQGLEKGMEKGMEKGLEKGMEKGLEKGKRQTAYNMSRKGYTDEIIADLLEVDLKTVKEWISTQIQ